MSKKRNKLLLLAGVGATLGYAFLKNTGILNRAMYRKEYEAVSRYVDAHFPGAAFTEIQKTDTGFITVVTLPGGAQKALTFSKADEEIYDFSETDIG